MALCRLHEPDDDCPHCNSYSHSPSISSISLPQSFSILSSLQHQDASLVSSSSFLSADTCPFSLSLSSEITANAMDRFSDFTLSLGSQDESCSQLCGTESPCPQCVAEAHLTKPSAAVRTNEAQENHLSTTSESKTSRSDAQSRKRSGPSGVLLCKEVQLRQAPLCKSNDVVVQGNSSGTRSSERCDAHDEVRLPSRSMGVEVKHSLHNETDIEVSLMRTSRYNIIPAAGCSNRGLLSVVGTEQDNQNLAGKENINKERWFIKKAGLVAVQEDLTSCPSNASAKRKVGYAVADENGWLCPRDGKKNFKPKPRQSLLDGWLRKQR